MIEHSIVKLRQLLNETDEEFRRLSREHRVRGNRRTIFALIRYFQRRGLLPPGGGGGLGPGPGPTIGQITDLFVEYGVQGTPEQWRRWSGMIDQND
jgi:hypothetical protein